MIQTKSIPLELKALEDSGRFTGYGSVFGVTDSVGDVVEPGAFSGSLKEWKTSGRIVPVLWQHKTAEPIGDWHDLKEDDRGLLGEAELWVAEAPYARIAHRGMKSKAITGLSIGYRVKRETYDKKAGVNRLHEVDLVEISVVTNPANDDARVGSVKSLETMLKAGNLPTLSQFEDFLREAGFSKSQATAVAGNGLRKLLDQREAEKADPTGDEVLRLLSEFSVRI